MQQVAAIYMKLWQPFVKNKNICTFVKKFNKFFKSVSLILIKELKLIYLKLKL